ncbi:MAG: YdcF family protein [Bosea sp. (in: a-proteobacteria)]
MTRGLLATAGLVAVAGAIGFLFFVQSLARAEPSSIPAVRGIAVVTGGAQRIGDAMKLLGSSRTERLLISGVNEKTGLDEIVRLNPVKAERISCCVDLDHRARNTIGNAIETRRWQRRHGFDSIMVVTSNYHMPRTLLEFRHAMPGVKLVARPVVSETVDVANWWRDFGTWRLVSVEYVKYLAALARTQIESDPETSRLSIITGGRKPVSPKGQDAFQHKGYQQKAIAPPVLQSATRPFVAGQ